MKLLAPLTLAALGAGLAACQPAAPADNGVTANAAAPRESGYIAKVQALAPGQREIVLFRAIQDGGGRSCQGVKKVEPIAPSRAGQPNWRVTCTDDSQWAVSLADDGTALVTGARAQ